MITGNSDTHQIQLDFASYCKTGEYKPLPGVTPNRVHHYRRLVFNVVKNTLEQAYPLTYDILGEDKWAIWVDKFFTLHDPQSPQVWKLPLEFYEWAVDYGMAEKSGLAFINDLLLFEWLEIEVYTMPDIDIPESVNEGDLLADIMVINPEYRLLELDYPVHKIPAKELDQNKGQYFVLAFREPLEKKVEFVDLSIFYVFLLDRIINQNTPLADVLLEAVTVFKLGEEKELNNKVQEFFDQLRDKGFVLGFQK